MSMSTGLVGAAAIGRCARDLIDIAEHGTPEVHVQSVVIDGQFGLGECVLVDGGRKIAGIEGDGAHAIELGAADRDTVVELAGDVDLRAAAESNRCRSFITISYSGCPRCANWTPLDSHLSVDSPDSCSAILKAASI